MKTNSSWIKTDYHVQTYLGFLGIALLFASLFGCIFSKEAAFVFGCLVILLLIPIGAWQVLSGIIYALSGDRLQQIYLCVVAFYFGVVFIFCEIDSIYRVNADIFLIMMGIIAFVIAVWKYTVVRADYISLKIIDVPKVEIENFLDA
jgi:hypothetical protein